MKEPSENALTGVLKIQDVVGRRCEELAIHPVINQKPENLSRFVFFPDRNDC